VAVVEEKEENQWLTQNLLVGILIVDEVVDGARKFKK